MNRILSINVDHGWESVKKVIALLNKLDPTVVLLQDVPFKTGRKPFANLLKRKCGNLYAIYYPEEDTINVSSTFRVDNIILLRHNLKFKSRIDGYGNLDLVSLFGIQFAQQVEGQEKTFSIFSIYIRPEAEHSEVQRALDWLSSNNPSAMEDTFLLGDLNAYNTAWAEPRLFVSDKYPKHVLEVTVRAANRGRVISDWSRRNQLQILNDIQEGPTCYTRIQSRIHKSYIDVAMAGERAAELLLQFSLYDIESTTLHRAIILDKAEKIRPDKILLRLDRLPEFRDRLASLNSFGTDYPADINLGFEINYLAYEFVTRLDTLQQDLTEINGVPASLVYQQSQDSQQPSEDKRSLNGYLEEKFGWKRLRIEPRTFEAPVERSIVPVTQHELEHVFQLLYPADRQYGPDEHDHQLFAATFDQLKGIILRICKLSFQFAFKPDICKQKRARVHVQDDGSYQLVERTGPLCLILDKMHYLRFLSLMEVENMIHPTLFDYPLSSRHDLMATVLYERAKFEDHFCRVGHALMTIIKLRFKNSLESVPYERLIDYLKRDFGQDPTVAWIINSINGCSIRVSDEDFESDIYSVTSGVFKGSPLADALWIYVMQQLRKETFSTEMEKFKILIHQDDLFIIYDGFNKKDTQVFLEILEDGFNPLDLKLAFDECSYKTTTHHGTYPQLPIEYGGRSIQQVKQLEIIGIPISKLGMKLVENDVIRACRQHSTQMITALSDIFTSDSPDAWAEVNDFINNNLVPTILEPVLSILPVSHAAMRFYADVLGTIIKDGVSLPVEVPAWLARILFGVTPIKFLVLEFLVGRILEVPTQDLIEAYGHLIEQLDSTYNVRFDLDKNLASLKGIMSRRKCRYPIHSRPIIHEEDEELSTIKQFFKHTLDKIRPECEADELSGLRGGLCADPSIWAKYPLGNLTEEHALVLSGKCRDGDRGRVSKLEPGEMPPGCSARECSNHRSNFVLHRLYDCPRYNFGRILFEEELGVPSGSTLEQYVPVALIDEEKNKILMDHLYLIADYS